MARPHPISEVKHVQGPCLEWAKKRRVPTIRLSFMKGAAAGWPDVLFLIPGGKPVFIEFKAPGKKPTAKQAHRIAQLKEVGYDVHVVDDAQEGQATLQSALDEANKRLHQSS